jgi:hypothetical protein
MLDQLKQDSKPLYEVYLLKEMLLSIFDENIPKDEAKPRCWYGAMQRKEVFVILLLN